MSRLCCVNATKRLFETVVQVSPGDIVILEIAREIMELFDQNPIMADLPLLAITCSNQDLAFDIMTILSCFRGLSVDIFPHAGLPNHLPALSAIRPLAGRQFGPDFLSQVVSSASYDGYINWEPLYQFSSIFHPSSATVLNYPLIVSCSESCLFPYFHLFNLCIFQTLRSPTKSIFSLIIAQ